MRKPINKLKRNSGMTLMELTVVLIVMLVIAGAIMIGVKGYLAGTNRALCILTQHTIQDNARSYANMYELNIGDAMAHTLFIDGADKLLPAAPVCKAGGTYTYTDVVPDTSVEYATCSDATHLPKTPDGW